jgi:hypothetical protein
MHKIEINNLRKVIAVQKEFSEIFPHLRIDFHLKPHQSHGENTPKMAKKTKLRIGDCRVHSHTGYLYLNEEMTVKEFKSYLTNEFGLAVEIFQKIEKGKWSKNPIYSNQLLAEINFEID